MCNMYALKVTQVLGDVGCRMYGYADARYTGTPSSDACTCRHTSLTQEQSESRQKEREGEISIMSNKSNN